MVKRKKRARTEFELTRAALCFIFYISHIWSRFAGRWRENHMNKISVLALFLLVVAAVAGCQSANANEEWMRRHPPVEFTPSGRSSEPQPDISSQPVREDPPVTTVEPTTDLPVLKDAGHPEWRFKGTRKWTFFFKDPATTERGSAASFDRSHRRRALR